MEIDYIVWYHYYFKMYVFTCLYMYMEKRSYAKIIEMVSLGGGIASN